MWRKVNCWWESKSVQPLWKTAWGFLKKLKMDIPYNPVSPIQGIYAMKTKTLIWNDICTSMFISTLFTTVKLGKQSKHPMMDEWIKMWYLCTMEYYSAIKQNELLPYMPTDRPRGYYATWKKSDRRQILLNCTYMWNLNNKTKSRNRSKNTENKVTVDRGRGNTGF